jgi:anti-sigma B factor antagonist
MNLATREEDGVSVLSVSGEVDLSNSTTLRRELRRELEQRKRGMVVELGAVEHIDSSGIAVLIEGKGWAQGARRGFVLAQPSQRVRMVIELARLQDFFAIEADTPQAVARAQRRETE